MSEDFNYSEAVRELEKIALTVEDPQTGVEDMDRYIRRTEELAALCREYLRSARKRVEEIR